MNIADLEIEIQQHRKAWEDHELASRLHHIEAMNRWCALIAAKNRLREAKAAEANPYRHVDDFADRS